MYKGTPSIVIFGIGKGNSISQIETYVDTNHRRGKLKSF